MLSALLLSGCSKGPSERDAKAALSPQFEIIFGMMGSLPGARGGPSAALVLDTLRLGECREAVGCPGYVCTYSLDINGGRVSDEARFVKDASGWLAFKS